MALFELNDIHHGWAGRGPVLAGVSLTLAPGEKLAVTGHNGAGKSTLLKIMLGLITPDRGAVTAFGRMRTREADYHEVRRRAGLVFQDADDQLFCPTVADDIAFGPLNLGKSREEALDIVDTLLMRLNLSYLRDAITHRLSGGEKRLVTLACVLAMEPEVLLLDEPTNALDEENETRLVEILQDLPQAMVLISHDAHFRRKIVSRSLRLQDGVLSGHRPACRNAS